MFVIAQSWKNLENNPEARGLSIEEKIGLSLQHAGVAITVTSVTDIIAFSIGAVSVSTII